MRTFATLWLLGLLLAPQPANSVIDGKTMAPIPFALVLFARTDSALTQSVAVTTDEHGAFTATTIPPGTYRVFAEHSGYMRGMWPDAVTVRAGAPITGLSIALTPTAVIAGRITTEAGEPAPKVYVRAYRTTAAGLSTEVAAETRTNDLGDYRLIGLAPGSYAVSAEPYPGPSIGPVELPGGRPGSAVLQYIVPTPPCPDCRGEGRGMQALPSLLTAGAFIHPSALSGLTYPRIYFPGTLEVAESKAVVVAAGGTANGIDLRLVVK